MTKNAIAGWPVWLLILMLAGCHTHKQSLQRFAFEQPHMGTLWRITLYAPDQPAARTAAQAAFARVETLNQVMTDYDTNSEVMRLCRGPAHVPVPVSEDLFTVLELSRKLWRETQGAFDPTVGPYVRQWRRARRQGELPAPARLESARRAVGFDKVHLDSRRRSVTLLATNMILDLGGIGKGFAADAALRELRARGLGRALIAASGDLAIGDPPPGETGWRVAIGDLTPSPTNAIVQRLLLRNAGVSTSGDTEQFVEIDGIRYSHVVDPRTGVGLTERIQVTIIAPNATRSDSLATAVCVLGARRGLDLIERDRRLAAFVITLSDEQKQVLKSSRFRKLERKSLPATNPTTDTQ